MAKIVITCRGEDKEHVEKLAQQVFNSFSINEDATDAHLNIRFEKTLKLEIANNQLVICVPFQAFPFKQALQTSIKNAMKLGAAWICGKNILGAYDE